MLTKPAKITRAKNKRGQKTKLNSRRSHIRFLRKGVGQ